MKHYGLQIVEGSEILNLTVPTGTAFPSNDNVGELFYRTDIDTLNIRRNSSWESIPLSTGLSNVVEDITPQLGGNLESNGNDIIIASSDKITITDAPVNPTDGVNKTYVDINFSSTSKSYFYSSF